MSATQNVRSGDEAAVIQAIESLRKAMLEADRKGLLELIADELSYGHSSGLVETKSEFIDVVANKKTIFKSIALIEPSIVMAGDNAIARHIFVNETESSDGRPGVPRVGAMQLWTKRNGSWKLLARQAFRL